MSEHGFGRYTVEREIGHGTMGVVYRALDPAVGRAVAIKAIRTGLLEGLGVSASEYFERFRREAEAAGRLSHPNIVKIFDLGPDYLVMELVEGQSLAALIAGPARLAPAEILRVLAGVADALDYAHSHGVVHRDVKPANIMVQPDGTPKVMDFGVARLESSTLTAAGQVLGSAAYMAPEVVLGEAAGPRSDVFSLGVVGYELVTGVRPFGGASITAIIESVVRRTPPPPRERNGALPLEYDAAFDRALAKQPEQRWPSARAFVAALGDRPWSQAAPPGGPSPTAPGSEADDEATLGGTALAEAPAAPAPRPRAAPVATLVALAAAALLAITALAGVFAHRLYVRYHQEPASPLPPAAAGEAEASGTPPALASHGSLTAAPPPSTAPRPGARRPREAAPATAAPAAPQVEATPEPPRPAPRTGDLVPQGPGVTPPRRVSGESPRTPQQAAREGVSGSVLVEFQVDEEGRVQDPRVVESAGEILDAAALAAVRGWRYEPATAEGVRVKVVERARFTFRAR